MLEIKIIASVIASGLEILGTLPYLLDIIARKTKPHFFTWFVWAILNAIGFAALLSAGAGMGAWVVAVTTITCFSVAVFAFFRGEKNITRVDWICLVAALLCIGIWQMTDSTLLTIILLLAIETFAFVPTVRKSITKPYEETLSMYLLTALKHLFAFAALQSYAPASVLYIGFLFVENAGFALMLAIRRRTAVGIHSGA